MIGKKNIAFGFIYLVFTAALGPYMLQTLFPTMGEAMATKQQDVGFVQSMVGTEYENMETMEPMTAAQIAKANSKALLALNQVINAQGPIDSVKGGPHAHGNLEAVLNIIAGLTLCFLAAPVIFKQIVSWLFILGAVLHSGMLYLRLLEVGWAGTLLNIGPWVVLTGLAVLGIGCLFWLKPEVVRD